MSRRLFVCHASAEIESTSEIVDALESALDFPAGALWTSHLPGYLAHPEDNTTLRDRLADTSVVLALVSPNSARDPHFVFELGAAWALGIRIVLLMLNDADTWQLPVSLRDATIVHGPRGAEWTGLLEDLSQRLGFVPHTAAVRLPSFAEARVPAEAVVLQLEAAKVDPAFATTAVLSDDELGLDNDAITTIGEDNPARSYIQELLNIEAEAAAERATAERVAAEHAAAEAAAVRAAAAAEAAAWREAADAAQLESQEYVHFVPRGAAAPSEPPAFSSDVFARLPSCSMALEAGRSVSDCAFNRTEISDLEQELSGPLGPLVNALGGSWNELRTEQDFDIWLVIIDQLLEALPEEARKIEDWYRLGFELATLHNLAGQLVLDGTDAAAEQQWRGALERFLMRAERAEIGYENLGRVLGLLENLAGPSSERDLANIGLSLDELRRIAAGADAIHTAA